MDINDIEYLENDGDPRVVLDKLQEIEDTPIHKLSITTRYEFLEILDNRSDDSRQYYDWLSEMQCPNNIIHIARKSGRINFKTFLGETELDIHIFHSEPTGTY